MSTVSLPFGAPRASEVDGKRSGEGFLNFSSVQGTLEIDPDRLLSILRVQETSA